MSAKIINAEKDLSEKQLLIVTDTLRDGGVIIYPTETVYGFGCDAFNAESVQRIRKIKGRDNSPFLILIPDFSWIRKISDRITESAEILSRNLWPGPLTLIVDAKPVFPEVLTGRSLGIGIRVSSSEISNQIVRKFGCPIVSTSANMTGKKPALSGADAAVLFRDQTDLIIDTGKSSKNLPSTVVDTRQYPPVIIREGAVPSEKIFGILSGKE